MFCPQGLQAATPQKSHHALRWIRPSTLQHPKGWLPHQTHSVADSANIRRPKKMGSVSGYEAETVGHTAARVFRVELGQAQSPGSSRILRCSSHAGFHVLRCEHIRSRCPLNNTNNVSSRQPHVPHPVTGALTVIHTRIPKTTTVLTRATSVEPETRRRLGRSTGKERLSVGE